MSESINPKLQSFKSIWDTEYISIDHQGIQGDFYPNERGLVIIRHVLKSNQEINELVVDGDFDLINNFDDAFYAFAHLIWDGQNWVLNRFNYDNKIDL